MQYYAGAPSTGYCYDAANQLAGISYSNAACGGAADVSYTYYSDGLRHTMVDSTGTTTYAYDTLKRLRQMTNGAGAEVDYDYNPRGLLTQLTYPSAAPRNHIVTRAYDDAGRLTQVALSPGWVAGAQPNNFTYDADGNLCLVQYGNGVYGSRGFDAADRLTRGTGAAMVYGTGAVTGCTQVTKGILLSLSYPRDANGQITAEGSTGYGYDPLNRLTTAAAGSYTVDKADELTQQPFPSPTQTTSFTYDAANQLKTGAVSGAGPSYTYSFDSGGNRHTRVDGSGNTLTYNYDQLNRLTGHVPAGASPPTYGYTYNGDGLRMAKSSNGSSTASFTWDLAEGLPLVLSDGSTSYVTGPGGLPLEQVTATGSLYFYQADQLGSTRLITSSSGGSVDTYTYDAYGNLTASTGSLANPFQFAGQYVDSESGLYYLRARYYDPSSAQFLSRDPAVAATRQPYSYSGDNPLNLTDPSGLDWEFALPGGGALAGGGLAGCVFGGCEAAVAAAPFVLAAATGAVIGVAIAPTVSQGLDAADPYLVGAAQWVGSNWLNAKRSKQSGKEKADDIPSWAGQPLPGENGKTYAGRECDVQFGPGEYDTGPGSDYNKLKKYGDRKLRN